MTDSVKKPIDSIIAETKRQIQPYVFKRLESRRPRQAGRKIARTITITSGKGGVGKTNIVANLAICLAQAGRRVIILDADLGLANIDVVFGIRPKHNLTDVVTGDLSLDQIMIPGPRGIQIIAGGSGISELAHLPADRARRLFEQLRFLEDKADYLLIDTGAGIGENVISFCLAADQIFVVTTPEPTAMADAYGIIKVISQSRPEAHLSVLVNRVADDQEGVFVHDRLARVAEEYLRFPVRWLGAIPQDPQMYLAVRQQTPLLLFSPMSPAAQRFRKLVAEVFHETLEEQIQSEGMEGFLTRLSKFFGGGVRE
ncbi:MAG TPA: MinD/ParA family protein [Candidatus Ozemobacteraceae bacterium]